MSEVVIVAILSLIGTLIGSLTGILTANKLTNYRIEQLEKKVEKHNNVIERVYKLEKEEAVIQEEISQLKVFHEQQTERASVKMAGALFFRVFNILFNERSDKYV